MFPAATPKTAQLTGTVRWSDSTLFDGYVVLALGLPSDIVGTWPTVMIGAGKFPSLRLPIWTVVPISQGAFNQNTNLFFNSSIDPPGTKYGAYWYDINWRLVYPAAGVAATPFTISATPYAISIPPLTIPSPAISVPLPQTSPNYTSITGGGVVQLPGTPLTISGTQNSVNTSFTLSSSATYILLFKNGQLLTPGSDYSVVGTSLTIGLAPAAADVLQAILIS